jgi:hypothetical protein
MIEGTLWLKKRRNIMKKRIVSLLLALALLVLHKVL